VRTLIALDMRLSHGWCEVQGKGTLFEDRLKLCLFLDCFIPAELVNNSNTSLYIV
jgi:hypothetical protein